LDTPVTRLVAADRLSAVEAPVVAGSPRHSPTKPAGHRAVAFVVNVTGGEATVDFNVDYTFSLSQKT